MCGSKDARGAAEGKLQLGCACVKLWRAALQEHDCGRAVFMTEKDNQDNSDLYPGKEETALSEGTLLYLTPLSRSL